MHLSTTASKWHQTQMRYILVISCLVSTYYQSNSIHLEIVIVCKFSVILTIFRLRESLLFFGKTFESVDSLLRSKLLKTS